MTNPGIYFTRGTLLAQDVDIVGSLLNNIKTIIGSGIISLDGTQLVIFCRNTGNLNLLLPKITTVGTIILFIINASVGNKLIDVIPNAVDNGIYFPAGTLLPNPAGVLLPDTGDTLTLISDATNLCWYVLADF